MSTTPEVDALSEILRAVKLDSAFYFNAEFSAPWMVLSPESCNMFPHLSLGSTHLIIFHLVTEGRAYVRVKQEHQIELMAGDIVAIPHGDAHTVGNGSSSQATAPDELLDHLLTKGLKVAKYGGGGEVTSVVCGYLACEPRLCKFFLGSLPPLIKINIRGDSSGQWLENSIRYSVNQALSPDAGNRAVLAKLSEALFVETIRRYLQGLPVGETGWLAGVRDAEVGKALALLHHAPELAWTIAGLAKEVGVSRSTLAERFRHFLGEPPMSYLNHWRLQLGARMLGETSRGVADIAAEVGYESEASFNRAFKRRFGVPPGRYRQDSKREHAAAKSSAL
ncbi:MAG: AraC family transcriptional regulator [Candidatus Korobacteraceae bacterium]